MAKWNKDLTVVTFRSILVDRAEDFKAMGWIPQIRKTGRNTWSLFYRWGYGKKWK